MPVSCLPAPLFSSKKLSPPEARNEFTVTEYTVAGAIGVPLSQIPVIREPTGLLSSKV